MKKNDSSLPIEVPYQISKKIFKKVVFEDKRLEKLLTTPTTTKTTPGHANISLRPLASKLKIEHLSVILLELQPLGAKQAPSRQFRI